MQSDDEFVDVPGYPGYTCNRKGEIRGQPSLNYPNGKLLKPSLGGRKGTQRLKVALCRNNIPQTIQVHIIIGLTFLGPRPHPGWSIDHIDCLQPLNNHINNLRWASSEMQEANKPMQRDNTSGAKGLIKHGKKGWVCSITHEGTRYRAYFVKKCDAFEWLKARRLDLGLSIDEHIFGKFVPG